MLIDLRAFGNAPTLIGYVERFCLRVSEYVYILWFTTSQRLSKKVPKSQIRVLLEFSKPRARNTRQSNQGDGRKRQTALTSGISGASFEENGSPEASKKGPEIADTSIV